MNVRLIAIAGPPSAGKTAVVKQIIRNLGAAKVAYLKIDVVQAWEDEELAAEFGIPTKKVYSGDMCPDHMGIMVIRDALLWADSLGAEYLLYESAGLCLRCTPYTTRTLPSSPRSILFPRRKRKSSAKESARLLLRSTSWRPTQFRGPECAISCRL